MPLKKGYKKPTKDIEIIKKGYKKPGKFFDIDSEDRED